MHQHRRDPLVGGADLLAEPLADLGEAQAGLVAPVAQPAGARVGDADQRAAARPLDDVAVEDRPAQVVEVVADEVAGVVVAGHREPVVALERRGHGVEAERLPRLPGRGVVAGVEHDGGAGPVADRAGDPVHADVVVPVRDQHRDRLALLGLPELEPGRGLGGGVVELGALLVGRDRALDEPAGVDGGRVAADLDPGSRLRHRYGVAEVVRQRQPRLLRPDRLAVARPRLPDQDDRDDDRGRDRHAPRRCSDPAPQLAPARPARAAATPPPAPAPPAHRAARRRTPCRRPPPRPARSSPPAGWRSARSARPARRSCRPWSCRARRRRRAMRPESTRRSGSTGPVCTTTHPSRSGGSPCRGSPRTTSRSESRKNPTPAHRRHHEPHGGQPQATQDRTGAASGQAYGPARWRRGSPTRRHRR